MTLLLIVFVLLCFAPILILLQSDNNKVILRRFSKLKLETWKNCYYLWTYRAFFSNEYNSRTSCGNSFHSIRIYVVFRPYVCVYAPVKRQKIPFMSHLTNFIVRIESGSHEPPNRNFCGILSNRRRTQMAYWSLQCAIPCALLGWLFYDKTCHIVCIYAWSPCGWYDASSTVASFYIYEWSKWEIKSMKSSNSSI